MARTKRVYLGRRVRDIPPKGLSHVSEVRGIANAIVKDAKRGRISRRKANARLLVLWFASKRSFRGKKRAKALTHINRARVRLGLNPIRRRGRRGRRGRR